MFESNRVSIAVAADELNLCSRALEGSFSMSEAADDKTNKLEYPRLFYKTVRAHKVL